MAKAPWTFEVAPWRSDPKALDRYAVEDASGQRVGLVFTVVRHDGDVYLVVDREPSPVTKDLRALPWNEIESVDHTAVAVRLKVPASALDDALELDPDRQVQGAGADAERVTELPQELRPAGDPAAQGVVQRPLHAGVLVLTVLGAFTLLGTLAAAEAAGLWALVFLAVPLALFLAAFLGFYRVYQNPQRRDQARRPQPVDAEEKPRERRDARPRAADEPRREH